MTDRDDLTNDLFDILLMHGYINEDIKARIVIALDKYEIRQRTTDIVPADEKANANVIRQFAISKAVAGRSKKTIKQYTLAIERFARETGVNVTEATAKSIRHYLAIRMTRDNLSAVSLGNERLYLSSFFDWAVKEELMIRNPALQVETIKAPKIQKKAFTDLECERLRNACITFRDKALVEMLFSTACRISEIAAIKTCDIDGKRIMVCGKGNKYAQVYLDSKAQLAIENFVNARTDNNSYLFPGRGEGHATKTTLERAIKAIGERAGVDNVHAHRFRRTAATQALKRGMPIEMVSKFLRHEKISTTMLYLDLADDELSYQHQKYVG